MNFLIEKINMNKFKYLKIYLFTNNAEPLKAHINNFFFKTEYKFEWTNLDECDIIATDILSRYNSLHVDKYFINYILDNKHLILNKNILSLNFHESLPPYSLEKRLDILKKELNINSDQIFHVEATLTDFRTQNSIPLEFKFRQFLFSIEPDPIEFKNIFYDNIRTKKLTFLTNKIKLHRLQIFDKVMHLYNNVDAFKTENNVSLLNAYGMGDWEVSVSEMVKQNGNFLHFDLNYYNNLNLPWYVDKPPQPGDMPTQLDSLFNLHKKSIFSLISETNNESIDIHIPYYRDQFEKMNYKLTRVSEKSILPLVAGALPFFITDFMYYRIYEKMGFDFGYLKDIFEIEYRTNTEYENFQDLNKFIPIIKNSTIEELNSVRKNLTDYIDNNYEVAKRLLFDGVSIEEQKFLDRLTSNT